MINVMYIPLDERPCNYIYPQKIAAECEEINLMLPPERILGLKKKPANTAALWDWIEKNVSKCTYLIASIDMLIYGGITPSRLHYMDSDRCIEIIEKLKSIKKTNPSLTIYAFNLIMRVPSYNSDDEEPDYYAEYGEKIFRYSWCLDKINRCKASFEEKAELEGLKSSIPENVLKDFIGRRKVNSFVNSYMIELARENIIDYLVIPLDDCAEYGYSASEQQDLLKKVENYNLADTVYLYPGADEVCCTLLARVVNTIRQTSPKVFVRYSSTAGPNIIPKYEDRPLGESIKYQIIASGGIPADSSYNADFILMVNSPAVGGEEMCEAAFVETDKNRSYYSYRNIREFAISLKQYIYEGKKCAIADVAFCNGADVELMRLLSKNKMLEKLLSYAGWNTSSNTLGTVIAHSTVRYIQSPIKNSEFYLDRLIEDWGYQSDIRQMLISVAGEMKVSCDDLGNSEEIFTPLALKKLTEFIDENFPQLKESYHLKGVYFPWNRLFEIGLVSKLK